MRFFEMFLVFCAASCLTLAAGSFECVVLWLEFLPRNFPRRLSALETLSTFEAQKCCTSLNVLNAKAQTVKLTAGSPASDNATAPPSEVDGSALNFPDPFPKQLVERAKAELIPKMAYPESAHAMVRLFSPQISR